MVETVDLAVIGAGPAGLAAATVASELGLSVILLDEQPAPGGQIYRNIESFDADAFEEYLDEDYSEGRAIAEAFRASDAKYRPNSTVWRIDQDGSIAWTDGSTAQILKAGRIIAATGALERPVPIPGWTLPGVLGVGAAQIMLKSAVMVPDGPTIIAGNGPLIYLVANQLYSAGAEIEAVLETTRFRDYVFAAPYAFSAMRANEYLSRGAKLLQNLKKKGLKVQSAISNLAAHGDRRLQKITYTANSLEHEVEANVLLLHQGVVPNVQITRQVEAEHEWYEPQRYWRPKTDPWGTTSIDTLAIAGDGAGIFGAEAAVIAGKLAALETAYRAGQIDKSQRDIQAKPLRREQYRIGSIRPLLDQLYHPSPDILAPANDTLVCRCEEVTAGDIRKCIQEGATDPNQLKAYTRCGMGPCQGRMCGLSVTEVIADAQGKSAEEIGYYRLRPPIKPITLSELAAMKENTD
ncbi:MAG: FAD/NAD(P)-binding oxidoreductase [Rickettsiales bacterium]|nr:FAD/NAD(P)-binding oxidoreductase [Rickettsiales bacterium]